MVPNQMEHPVNFESLTLYKFLSALITCATRYISCENEGCENHLKAYSYLFMQVSPDLDSIPPLASPQNARRPQPSSYQCSRRCVEIMKTGKEVTSVTSTQSGVHLHEAKVDLPLQIINLFVPASCSSGHIPELTGSCGGRLRSTISHRNAWRPK